MLMTLVKVARFRIVKNKALKVNAFYYVVALMEWLSCPEQGVRLVRTLRVSCKIRDIC